MFNADTALPSDTGNMLGFVMFMLIRHVTAGSSNSSSYPSSDLLDLS